VSQGLAPPVGVPPAAPPLERTPLHGFHASHGAHFVPFAGWEMPLYYGGVIAEHEAVRRAVGLFDVSHMGIVTVRGGSGPALLSRRTTANVGRLAPGQCRYTFLLDSAGLIVDDLLITRTDDGRGEEREFVVVPNAATAAKVTELLKSHRRPDTTVARWNHQVAILAVQGPESRRILEAEFGWALGGLRFYHGRFFPMAPETAIPTEGVLGRNFPDDLGTTPLVCRTGYTGELGFELFVTAAQAPSLAERLVARGVVPTGLAARDTLRLEKGYLLSGQDFHLDRTPLEAGQEKFVDFDHPFVGKEALEQQRSSGPAERLVGLTLEEEGAIPRHGTPIFAGDSPIAPVTSGGHSPTLHRGIALAYLPAALTAVGTEVALEIRGRRILARVAPLPFVPAASAKR
jgi:aminomethyltransferase